MADDQTGLSALSRATGLTRGLPSWKEGLAKVIESIMDATAGILRSMGLMQPGAMRNPQMLRAALQKAGISVPWIGAILAAIQADGGAVE